MLHLPQPFANCYILLFSLSKGQATKLLGWNGGWLVSRSCSLAAYPPVFLWICLFNLSVWPTASLSLVRMHKGRGEQHTVRCCLCGCELIIKLLFSALLTHMHPRRLRAIVFQHHGTMRATVGLVQGRGWDNVGVGRWRRYCMKLGEGE